ncbi:MAG: Lrp/AsnC family transcriptional regulator [Nanoarchaeota archaeon]
MAKLDEKACKILNLLQKNCRMSLTDISKEVGLSVDSVKKRIKKMIDDNIFYPRIQLRPRHFGFNNIIDIRIKLHNYNNHDMENFVEYLKESPNVVEIFALSGEWDFAAVILAKSPEDLGLITKKIRNKFGKIINIWSESLTTQVYKFEIYDMLKVMGFKKEV